MTKKTLYDWMDKQISACDIQNVPLDQKNPFWVNNAKNSGNEIHVYGIDNLCKKLQVPYEITEFSDECDMHHFMYKGYKFFGLVDKETKS